MTYAGLKSMIYAGLTPTTPASRRLGFIRRTYTVEENPASRDRALYYYYVTFAKALSVYGQRSSSTPRASSTTGGPTSSPAGEAAERGGSWVNPNDRFMEGDPNLVTAYGLLALAHAAAKA